MYLVEDGRKGNKFLNAPLGMWWAAVTVNQVGYGYGEVISSPLAPIPRTIPSPRQQTLCYQTAELHRACSAHDAQTAYRSYLPLLPLSSVPSAVTWCPSPYLAASGQWWPPSLVWWLSRCPSPRSHRNIARCVWHGVSLHSWSARLRLVSGPATRGGRGDGRRVARHWHHRLVV